MECKLDIKKSIRNAVVGICLAVITVTSYGDINEGLDQYHIEHHTGPATENIAQVATLQTSILDNFLDAKNSNKFLQLTKNLPSEDTFILIHENNKNAWWATFDFSETGHVKDDEKIDADDLLQKLKDGDATGNALRERQGLDKLYTIGWAVPPHYDSETKLLEWGTKIRDEDGKETVNYTVRLLGRKGIVEAVLITSENTLKEDIAAFKKTLKGFQFNYGNRYADFKSGDKVATYGLGALIVGGVAAVATKKGFWAALVGFFAAGWKFICIGFVAIGGWVRSVLNRK